MLLLPIILLCFFFCCSFFFLLDALIIFGWILVRIQTHIHHVALDWTLLKWKADEIDDEMYFSVLRLHNVFHIRTYYIPIHAMINKKKFYMQLHRIYWTGPLVCMVSFSIFHLFLYCFFFLLWSRNVRRKSNWIPYAFPLALILKTKDSNG